MNCRVALAQTNPLLGDLHTNLAAHEAEVARAREEGAELVVFPELSLTGYFLKDQTSEVGLERGAPELERLAELSRDVSLLVGFVERTPAGRLYNATGLFEDGRLVGTHRKVHLVSYGMFDEVRDFAAGEAFEPLESKYGRIGVLLCEDAWHLGGAYLHFHADVDLLVVPSAGPARGAETTGEGFASERTWDVLLTALASFTQTWVLYCNRVGFEDGIAFGGGTRVIDPFATTVARLEGLDTGRLVHGLDAAVQRRARAQTPLRRDEKPWLLHAQLDRRLFPQRGDASER